MSKIYAIKRVVAFENGKEDTINSLLQKSEGEKYIELLIPFSDPIAETPELQDASVRAMEHPHTTEDVFELLGDVAPKLEAKIILSIYSNQAYAIGYEGFCNKAKEAGVYALNIKDMPFAEKGEIKQFADACNLLIINTLATSRPETLSDVVRDSNEAIFLSPAMNVKYSQEALEAIVEEILSCNLDILTEN